MKKYLIRLSALTLIFAGSVHVALAQGFDGTNNELAQLLLGFVDFIDGVLVPLVFSIALIVFLWGVFRTFIAGGGNEEKREEGKKLILWGVLGMFVMVSIWGLVNLLTGTFRLDNGRPDFPTFNGATTGGGGGTTGTNPTFPTTGGGGGGADGSQCVLNSQCQSGQCFNFACQTGLPNTPPVTVPPATGTRPTGSQCVINQQCITGRCTNLICE